MRYLIMTILVILGSAGCGRIPFQKVAYVPVEAVQPEVVRQQFVQALARKFQLINSTVFRYNRHNISAVGYTAIDADRKAFTVVGLNPLGVKLFELSGDSNNVDCRFALEEFTRQGNFFQAVAEDIRRIYFDRIPAPEAEVYKEKYKIIFRQPAAGGTGTMEYVFAGADNLLIEKRYYQEGRRLWTIFYYEYLRENGKLYPAGIILKHYQYRYQLVVRLKEIRS